MSLNDPDPLISATGSRHDGDPMSTCAGPTHWSPRCEANVATTSRPSGSQPRPEGLGTSSSTVTSPPSPTLTIRPPTVSENHRRPSCQRGPSPYAKPPTTS